MTRSSAMRRSRAVVIGTFGAALLSGWFGMGLTQANAITPTAQSAGGSVAVPSSSVTRSKVVGRTHLIAGAAVVVDERTVRMSVSQTTAIRDRQSITVNWSGARPTAGLIADINSGDAALQEYPFVLMQCRGVDDPKLPAAQQMSPKTCWTQTPNERIQNTGNVYPPYQIDRYASAADRQSLVGVPSPQPLACSSVTIAHWVPFIGADGTVYPIGPNGCAGIPPEAVNVEGQLQPSNTTYGQTGLDGKGSATFIVQASETNASLGCSEKVRCSLVAVPIEGISCGSGGILDLDAESLGFVDRRCQATGTNRPGDFASRQPDLSVTGSLWWSASNWRNRISVPLSFTQRGDVCSILNSSEPVYLYGSETASQATLQWIPHFCLDKNLFNVRHVRTAEPQAKNLLSQGLVEAALQTVPPLDGYAKPVAQAPIALTGFVIAYSVDAKNKRLLPQLRLTPRLIAKLLSQSYFGQSDAERSYRAVAEAKNDAYGVTFSQNPLGIYDDPEFRALNPDLVRSGFYGEAAASLLTLSSDSDMVHSLSSYINADPVARAWLDGRPDPWGMVVNPAYEKIALPVFNWPLLDPFVPQLLVSTNRCFGASPSPWFSLLAAPVNAMSTISTYMQFSWANAQVRCNENDVNNPRLVALGRQPPGNRFTFGLTSLGDARRYGLSVASLENQSTVPANKKITDASGRTFVLPTDASIAITAKLLRKDTTRNAFVVPYKTLRSDPAAKGAYPGAQLISMAVPTRGVPAADAQKYAALIRYLTGPGQQRGFGNGQLAAGYVPMSAAAGNADLLAYSAAAADAVAAQAGKVPSITDPARSSTTPAPRPMNSTGGGSGGGGQGGVGGGGGGGASPTPTATTTAAPKPTTGATGPFSLVGSTAATPTPLSAVVLPLALVLALASGLAAVGAWGYREFTAMKARR